MSCVKIQILEDRPDWVKNEDGLVFLELGDEAELRLSKSLEEVNELGKIKTDEALPFSVPDTPQNWQILKSRIHADTLDQDMDPLLVSVSMEGITLLEQSLFVLGFGENKIELELRSGDEHWRVASDKKKINSIDLGQFELNYDNLEDNWNDKNSYVDDEEGVYFPLVNYGKFSKPNEFRPADFRPFVHILKLLQVGFCELGWTFNCEFLESIQGRKAITYLLRNNYGDDEQLRKLREFKAAGSILNPGTVTWPSEEYDHGDNFDLTYYQAAGTMVFKVFGRIDMEMDSSTLGTTVITFQLKRRFYDGSVRVIGEKSTSISNSVIDEPIYEDAYIEFESEEVNLLPEDRIWLEITQSETNVLFDFQGSFTNEVKSTFYINGDTIDIGSELDPDISLLDVLKGAIHLISGKVDANFNTKEISIYPDWDSIFYEQALNGFFRASQINDIREYQECDSEKITTPNADLKRYCRIEFAKSDDAAIKELNLPKEEPLYSRTVDRGPNYKEETAKKTNPLFEPTLNKELNTQGENSSFSLDVPYLFDNKSDESSYDIGPRILIAHGMNGATKKLPDDSLITGKMMWNGTELASYPYAAQFPNFFDPSGDPLPHLIYGDSETDLYNSFWGKSLQTFVDNLKVELLVNLDNPDYKKYSFRDLYTFTVFGRQIFGRLIEIQDFDPCEQESTPMVFLPDRQLSDLCLTEDTTNCDNNPKITITKNVDCYDFGWGGDFETAPETVVFEWSYYRLATWTTAVTVCNPTGIFLVRATFSYSAESGCPDQVITKTVDPCDNNPVLKFSYDFENEEVTISIEGEMVSTIDEANTQITYEIDGGGPVVPPAGSSVTVALASGEICASAVVAFDDCSNISLPEKCFTSPPEDLDCGQSNASITCVDVGQNMKTFQRSGFLVFDPAWDYIQYRNEGDSIWYIWDGRTPIQANVEVQRIAIPKDDSCPIYCSPIVLCE